MKNVAIKSKNASYKLTNTQLFKRALKHIIDSDSIRYAKNGRTNYPDSIINIALDDMLDVFHVAFHNRDAHMMNVYSGFAAWLNGYEWPDKDGLRTAPILLETFDAENFERSLLYHMTQQGSCDSDDAWCYDAFPRFVYGFDILEKNLIKKIGKRATSSEMSRLLTQCSDVGCWGSSAFSEFLFESRDRKTALERYFSEDIQDLMRDPGIFVSFDPEGDDEDDMNYTISAFFADDVAKARFRLAA